MQDGIGGNYVKIYRSMLEWEWYGNINTKVLFLHMLLKANWKEGKFQGQVIPRGSFVSSLQNLSYETALTIREVRTALEHLKSTGEVTSKGHNKYSIYTVVKYDLYQSIDTQTDNQETNNRQTNDKLTTTIEEWKKEKKERRKDNSTHFVPPSVEEVSAYCYERQNNVDPDRFVDFYAAKGWMVGKNKMKDWKASVRTWEAKKGGTDGGNRIRKDSEPDPNDLVSQAIAAGVTGDDFDGF